MDTDTSAQFIGVTSATRDILQKALSELDSWPDGIAESAPDAYLRHLLTVLEHAHGLLDIERRRAAVVGVKSGALSMRQVAMALGVTPATVMRWRDGKS